MEEISITIVPTINQNKDKKALQKVSKAWGIQLLLAPSPPSTGMRFHLPHLKSGHSFHSVCQIRIKVSGEGCQFQLHDTININIKNFHIKDLLLLDCITVFIFVQNVSIYKVTKLVFTSDLILELSLCSIYERQ